MATRKRDHTTAAPPTPNPLTFALLIGTAPELTADVVTKAYETAELAARRNPEPAEPGPPSSEYVVATRTELGDLPRPEEDELARQLGAPVEGRPIVKRGPVDTGSLSLAARRFLILAGHLPDLTTWEDRQALFNLAAPPGWTPTTTPED